MKKSRSDEVDPTLWSKGEVVPSPFLRKVMTSCQEDPDMISYWAKDPQEFLKELNTFCESLLEAMLDLPRSPGRAKGISEVEVARMRASWQKVRTSYKWAGDLFTTGVKILRRSKSRKKNGSDWTVKDFYGSYVDGVVYVDEDGREVSPQQLYKNLGIWLWRRTDRGREKTSAYETRRPPRDKEADRRRSAANYLKLKAKRKLRTLLDMPDNVDHGLFALGLEPTSTTGSDPP